MRLIEADIRRDERARVADTLRMKADSVRGVVGRLDLGDGWDTAATFVGRLP